MPELRSITPQRAAELLGGGALLVDIREADEHARERIAAARHHPASRFDPAAFAADGGCVIFHCHSGARTAAHAARLAQAPAREAYILEGGLDAWKRAGLPVVLDKGRPIEIQRQVQIIAGALVVLGAVLGMTVSPAFFAVPAFVGAGLIFAGATGFCGMAKLLAILPWNRQSA
ncbi:MAG: rhodanese family protein [Alphaproteobacteria bacterium]